MRHALLLFLSALLLACPPAADDDDATEDPELLDFPSDFLWGTASASWQVEGDYDPDPTDAFDVRSNWTVWTERGCVSDGQINERGSGFYTNYAEDFALAASLGNTTYRLGIDWARIEPEDDVWNEDAITHYVEVLQAAQAAGLQPMLTLHHWVVPTWVQNPTGDGDEVDMLAADADQMMDSRFVVEFEEFVRRIIPAVAPYVDLYPILNETFSVITLGYMSGACGGGGFPPGGLLDMTRARQVHTNYLFAHAAACHALRELDTVDADGDGQAALCGAAASTNIVRPMDPANTLDVEAAERIDWIYNHATHVALTDGDVDLDFDAAFDAPAGDNLPIDEGNYPELADTIDWIGVNYYGPVMVTGTGGGALGGVPSVDVADYNPALPASELGFAIDPGGFGEILDALWTYGKPMYITENGIGDTEDDDRPRFIVEHLAEVARAVDRGIDMRGYYHWSLTDNFEWAHGFHQRFGLYQVDYEDPDLPRIAGDSVDAYRAIIQQNEVTDAILEQYTSEPYPSGGGG